ncbi:MAG TPA: regulatory protein RecX [Solirubrobacterales bacterium]|nr:regulatory protein RecX [Solirubrobacterales bacterium]
MPESAQSEDAQLIALRALSHKERTVSEMLELLEGRGVERTERERVVGELIEIGTLDDRHYAEQFAADKRSLALWGRDRIQRTLIERGIDSSIATAAVDEPDAYAQEVERAETALASRDLDLATERDRRRGLEFLSRRGFEFEAAHDAIRRAQIG